MTANVQPPGDTLEQWFERLGSPREPELEAARPDS